MSHYTFLASVGILLLAPPSAMAQTLPFGTYTVPAQLWVSSTFTRLLAVITGSKE